MYLNPCFEHIYILNVIFSAEIFKTANIAWACFRNDRACFMASTCTNLSYCAKNRFHFYSDCLSLLNALRRRIGGIYEPRRSKTGRRVFRLGPTQTGM